MKRAPLNLVIDALAAGLFLGMVASGYVIRYPLPPGTHRVLDLWGLHRHQWGEIHFWLSIALLAILVVHLTLHWSWVVSMVKRHLGREHAPAPHLVRAGGITALAVVAGLTLFAWVAHQSVRTLGAEEDSAPSPQESGDTGFEPKPAYEGVFREVYAILKRSCLSCHGPDKELGEFRVDRREDFFGGEGRKPLVVPRNSAASPLIEIASGARPQMKMAARHRLPPNEVELLRAWIDAGAEWPRPSPP